MFRQLALLRVPIAAFVACAALVLAIPAHANAATASAQRLAGDTAAWGSAYAAAVGHWGAAPCKGDVRSQWGPLDRGILGLASWQAAPGASPDDFMTCAVTFNADEMWDYATFCSITVHEIGHLLGHEHTTAQGHVMSEEMTTYAPGCAPAQGTSAASSQTTMTTRSTTSQIRTTSRAATYLRRSCRKGTAARRAVCRRSLRRLAASRVAARK